MISYDYSICIKEGVKAKKSRVSGPFQLKILTISYVLKEGDKAKKAGYVAHFN